MGIITWSIVGAGGFFAVDGQRVRFEADLDQLVGFCLASSRICCNEDTPPCLLKYDKCDDDDSNFLKAQTW
jgi:hypothetical protein